MSTVLESALQQKYYPYKDPPLSSSPPPRPLDIEWIYIEGKRVNEVIEETKLCIEQIKWLEEVIIQLVRYERGNRIDFRALKEHVRGQKNLSLCQSYVAHMAVSDNVKDLFRQCIDEIS